MNTYKSVVVLFVVLSTAFTIAWGEISNPDKIRKEIKADLIRLVKAAKKLNELSLQPLPPGLIPEEIEREKAYNRFLRSSSKKIMKLVLGAARKTGIDLPGMGPSYGQPPRLPKTGNAMEDMQNQTKEMQEMQKDFAKQYLELQFKMESENRQFTTIANVMKTKHITVKAVINSIR